MSPYVIVDTTYNENLDPCANAGVDVMSYLDDVLPVFSSQESLWKFVRDWHSAQERIGLTPLKITPLELATMAEQFGATAGVRWVVINPEIGPSGGWILNTGPVPANSCRRYLVELTRGTRRVLAEGRERFRDKFSDSEELNEAVAIWAALQVDRVDADARARMGEWEVEDSPCYGEEDIQT